MSESWKIMKKDCQYIYVLTIDFTEFVTFLSDRL